MVGKAKIFSDQNRDSVYQKESDDENYAAAAQQNSYNLGSTHFSDQSGIGNFPQSGRDQRNAALKGALFRGNIGFDLQTVELDVPTMSIDLNNDATGTVLSDISTDRFVVLSAGTIGELVSITGAQRPGQRLRLYNTLTNTITIQHTAAATPDTIRTPDALPVTFEGNAALDFTFDITTAQWRVVGGPGTGGGGTGTTGTYTTADMDQDQGVNLAGGQHIQINQVIEDGGIVLQGQTPTFDQTSGIFELKEGKTYFLSAFIVGQVNAATDFAGIAWYDITNATEISRRTALEPMNKAQTLTCNGAIQTIYTPTTDVTVELRVVSLIGALTAVFQRATQCSIFEFSGKNGEAGVGGSPAWKTPARAKTVDDRPDLNNFNVIVDGITLVEDDRVLLTEQITTAENGLWQVGVVAGGLAPLTRPSDFDTDAEVLAQTFVAIEEGSIHKDQLWYLISNNPLTINVSPQVWSVFAPGTSGGPDLGGGEDGIDGAGEFVNDGRVALGNDILKRWQQIIKNRGPTYALDTSIYIPTQFPPNQVNPNRPGRVVVTGRMDQIGGLPLGTYTDNYGESFIDSTGLAINYHYTKFAYDPVAEVLITIGRNTSGGQAATNAIKRSTDRGANYVGTALGTATAFSDAKWVPAFSLFILVEGAFTNYAWTSPDGNTWTQQTVPAMTPDPPSLNVIPRRVEYSPSLGKFFIWGGTNALDCATSVDGVNWILETMPVPYTINPSKVIWSEGQQKFVMVITRINPNVISVFISTDGLTWEPQGPFPNLTSINVLAGVYDMIWVPELSLWLGIGEPDGAVDWQIFWASNDATTGSWRQYPELSFRIQDFDVGEIQTVNPQIARTLTYSPEYNYFFGAGNGQETAFVVPDYFRNRFWRTEVYFNGQLASFRNA